MVAYSFQKRFIGPIQSGDKTHTLRNERARHARPGEEVQLYTGMRTKHCQLIGRASCTAVVPITINFQKERISIGHRQTLHGINAMNVFARSDGFKDWAAMKEFWRAEHGVMVGHQKVVPAAWTGVMVEWGPLHAVVTVVDGCAVHGDKPLSDESKNALSTVIKAARSKLRRTA